MTAKYEQKKQREQINPFQGEFLNLEKQIRANQENIPNFQVKATENKEKSEQNSHPLTEEEFKDEFEGENFQQMNVGNCRMIATLDSFVSYGDFQNLIMNNVRKWTEKGKTFYEIKLPMNSPNAKTYKIFPNAKETHINGSSKEIINGKSGIVALMLALWEAITGKKNFSFSELDNGFAMDAMKQLLPSNFHFYSGTFHTKEGEINPWLEKTLENFNPEQDLLVLTMRYAWEKNGHFWRIVDENAPEQDKPTTAINHAFSVERTYKTKDKNGNIHLKVVLSNPYNSDSKENFTYDFERLKNAHPQFTLATTREYTITNPAHEKESPKTDKTPKIPSIKEVLQQTDKELTNAEIREISTTPLEYEVSSYGIDTRIKMNEQNITFTINGSSFNIPKNNLSKFYKGERNENYPFYLYAMQIANLLNRMQKNFISTKKWWENSEPFSYWILTLWDLRFKFKEDYLPTKVLESWEHLWIGETEDKNKLVNFLNSLYNK